MSITIHRRRTSTLQQTAFGMSLALLGLSVKDALLKIATGSLHIGHALVTFGIVGVIAFSAWILAAGEPPLSRAMLG